MHVAIKHLSICNFNISPPPPPPSAGETPGIWTFQFGGQIPVPQFQKAVQMPHVQDVLEGQMPHPWGIFF